MAIYISVGYAWQSCFRLALGHRQGNELLLQQGMALLREAELANQDTGYTHAFVLEQKANLMRQTDSQAALRVYAESLDLYRAVEARWEMANLMLTAGECAVMLGQTAQGKDWYTESQAIFQALGDQRGFSATLVMLGIHANRRWELEESARLLERAVQIQRAIGERASFVTGLYSLGYTLFFLGQFEAALAHTEESLKVATELGHRVKINRAQNALSMVEAHLGRYEQALARSQVALTMAREMGYLEDIAFSLAALSIALLGSGAFTEA